MKKLKINKNFYENYLTVGNLQFNTVLPNCPALLIEYAKTALEKNAEGAFSCVIQINREQELLVEKTLDAYDYSDKKIIARDFVCSLIMIELLKGDKNKTAQSNLMKLGVESICGKKPMPVKEYHKFSPLPCDISFKAMKFGKVELTFLLVDIENEFIQQAINNFLSSRDRHIKTKIFTTNEFLPSNYDQAGNLVQSIHDYTLKKPDGFVSIEDDIVME